MTCSTNRIQTQAQAWAHLQPQHTRMSNAPVGVVISNKVKYTAGCQRRSRVTLAYIVRVSLQTAEVHCGQLVVIAALKVYTHALGWLVCCWSFISWKHLRSCHDGYWVVTVHSNDDFIVLLHWEIRLLTPWPNYHTNAKLTSLFPIILMPSARLGSDKCQF